MGQAMEMDILEVSKSKKLLHAHFLLKNANFFCKWCKTTKRFTLFKNFNLFAHIWWVFLGKTKGGV